MGPPRPAATLLVQTAASVAVLDSRSRTARNDLRETMLCFVMAHQCTHALRAALAVQQERHERKWSKMGTTGRHTAGKGGPMALCPSTPCPPTRTI